MDFFLLIGESENRFEKSRCIQESFYYGSFIMHLNPKLT